MFWTTVPAHFGFSMKGFWMRTLIPALPWVRAQQLPCILLWIIKCVWTASLCKENFSKKKRERCIVSHVIFQKVFCNTSHHIKSKLLLFPPKVPWGVGGVSFRQLRVQPTTYLSAERLHLAATFTFPTNSQSIPRVFKHTVKMMLSKYPNNCLS